MCSTSNSWLRTSLRVTGLWFVNGAPAFAQEAFAAHCLADRNSSVSVQKHISYVLQARHPRFFCAQTCVTQMEHAATFVAPLISLNASGYFARFLAFSKLEVESFALQGQGSHCDSLAKSSDNTRWHARNAFDKQLGTEEACGLLLYQFEVSLFARKREGTRKMQLSRLEENHGVEYPHLSVGSQDLRGNRVVKGTTRHPHILKTGMSFQSRSTRGM